MNFLNFGAPAAVALALTIGCSQSPTSPTPATPGALVGPISQEPPPVPPRANPSVAITAVGATRFVAFGDSITYGVTAAPLGDFLFDSSPQGYPVRLRLGLNEHHAGQTFTVINRGKPGEGAIEGATRIAGVLQTDRPQGLLLLEGINDLNVGRSVGETVAALDTILDHARLHNVTVVIATMFQTYEVNGHTNAAEFVPSLNDGIRQVAAGRQNVFLVDISHAFGTDRSYVGGDGLHPTEAGYDRMASWFMAAIEAAFPVRGSFQ